MVKLPPSLDSTFRAWLVAVLVSVMLAPATTAEVESEMVPVISPNVWPYSIEADPARQKSEIKNR